MLIDTHAHIHFDVFAEQVEAVIQRAKEAGVTKIITVGVDADDSAKAVAMAQSHAGIWATVGVHPQAAAEGGVERIRQLATQDKVVAIGECGLDLYRSADNLEQQVAVLRAQIELAQELDLPLVFHVREAFEQFLPIVKEYPGIRGVAHSFTGTPAQLQGVLDAGLYVALNGIMTFSKDPEQLAMAKAVPLDRLILETDCPFLSPKPHRGKTNEPARIADIASWLADHRGETPLQLAEVTTANAEALFGLPRG